MARDDAPELEWCACQCGIAVEDSEVVVPLTILLTKNSAGWLDGKPQSSKCLVLRRSCPACCSDVSHCFVLADSDRHIACVEPARVCH